MKKQQSPRRRSGSTPIPVRHQFDHVVPTVIHHPEEKMTALGRWTHHVVQDPQKYATWAVAIAATVLAVVLGWKWMAGGGSPTSEVWSNFDTAKKAEDIVTMVAASPKSPAATWGLLRAANLYFEDGTKDLTNNRDVALPAFGKAIKLYEQVAREAPKDSFQARWAALGHARALEARNELAAAKEKYDLVVKNWPGSAEAEQAKELAEAIQQPSAAAFYKELYAFSPPKMTLPPYGSEKFDFPATGSTTKFGPTGILPSLSNLPVELAPPNLDIREPNPAKVGGNAARAGAMQDLPADVFSTKPGAPKEKSPR